MIKINISRSVQYGACAKTANEHDGLILSEIQPGDFLSAISLAALKSGGRVNSQYLGLLCIMVKSALHRHCCHQCACLVHAVRHCCTPAEVRFRWASEASKPSTGKLAKIAPPVFIRATTGQGGREQTSLHTSRLGRRWKQLLFTLPPPLGDRTQGLRS